MDLQTTDRDHDSETIAAFVRVLAIPLGREIASELRQMVREALAHGAGDGNVAHVEDLVAQLAVVTAQRDELAKDLAAAELNIKSYQRRIADYVTNPAIDPDELPVNDANCGNCYYRLDGLCTQDRNPNRAKKTDVDDGCVKHAFKPPDFGRDLPADLGEKAGILEKPGVKTCQWCLHWNRVYCRNEQSPSANMKVGAGNTCGEFVSCSHRRRALCPHCGHGVLVSGKGFMVHDLDGVVYRARYGDRDRPCPGSHAQPKS